MAKNIVLIGLMGSGKTSVGRLVAQRTGREFIDVDQAICDRTGLTIPEIFADRGENAFRDLETESLNELKAATYAVIATGGGAVVRPENRAIMQQLGTVFWLDAPPAVLYDRIGEDKNRPMIQGGDPLKKLTELMARRREFYAETSHVHLDTTELTPEEIVDRIVQELGDKSLKDEDVFDTIIAIDGPVGSGKSALAKALAKRLKYVHVDTGAMYRCVTLEAMRRGTSLTDAAELTALAHAVDIRFVDAAELDDAPQGKASEPGGLRVMLNGEDVTEAIRDTDVSRNTSPVADTPGVRGEMVRLQRQLALHGRSVLEGRDISTVVVPEARWQIYLVASLEERVERRYAENVRRGMSQTREDLRADVIMRDNRDRDRAQGALKLSPDAMIFDSTGIDLDEVVTTLAAMIETEDRSLSPSSAGD
ncbi:hypothetical protein CVU37_03955 [candidate division BRC1 bacterium HGW-BRC1-1]|jgi:cytidylate kinase|nr:MAG: hypothetical protein CVU37_03955 [candidate division BRC1 bacterium HGW-BRC1-1]